MSLLEVREATLRFGGVAALEGMSFEVEQGEIFAIVGPKIMLLDEPSLGVSPILNPRHLLHRPPAQPGARGRHAVGGAERPGRDRRRGFRLCDGDRADRDGRLGRTAQAEPRHPGVLPGRAGAESPR